MVNIDFDAARKKVAAEPFTFRLAGEEFTVPRDGGVMPLLDLASGVGDLADVADLDSTDIKAVARALKVFSTFATSFVTEDQRDRFAAALRRFNPDLNELVDLCKTLMAEVSGRPLERPSASEPSSSETSPPLKVVSLSEGTVRAANDAADVVQADTIPSFV